MEVVGALSSIFAVAELGLRVATVLGNYALAVKGSSGVICTLRDDIAQISAVLRELALLKDTKLDADGHIPLISPKQAEDIDAACMTCKATFDAIVVLLRKASRSISSNEFDTKITIKMTWVEKAVWPMLQSHLKDLKTDLLHAKSTLVLHLSLIQLQLTGKNMASTSQLQFPLPDQVITRSVIRTVLAEIAHTAGERSRTTNDDTILSAIQKPEPPRNTWDSESGRVSISSEESTAAPSLHPTTSTTVPPLTDLSMDAGEGSAEYQASAPSAALPSSETLLGPHKGSRSEDKANPNSADPCVGYDIDFLNMWTVSLLGVLKTGPEFAFELMPLSAQEIAKTLRHRMGDDRDQVMRGLESLTEEERHMVLLHTTIKKCNLLAVWVRTEVELPAIFQAYPRRPIWITHNVEKLYSNPGHSMQHRWRDGTVSAVQVGPVRRQSFPMAGSVQPRSFKSGGVGLPGAFPVMMQPHSMMPQLQPMMMPPPRRYRVRSRNSISDSRSDSRRSRPDSGSTSESKEEWLDKILENILHAYNVQVPILDISVDSIDSSSRLPPAMNE